MKKTTEKAATLQIRNAMLKDIPQIIRLVRVVYADLPAYSDDMIRGQITNFPEGQFVAVYDGKVVGYCATFMIAGELALKPHSWRLITGDGYGARHDEKGRLPLRHGSLREPGLSRHENRPALL